MYISTIIFVGFVAHWFDNGCMAVDSCICTSSQLSKEYLALLMSRGRYQYGEARARFHSKKMEYAVPYELLNTEKALLILYLKHIKCTLACSYSNGRKTIHHHDVISS